MQKEMWDFFNYYDYSFTKLKINFIRPAYNTLKFFDLVTLCGKVFQSLGAVKTKQLSHDFLDLQIKVLLACDAQVCKDWLT